MHIQDQQGINHLHRPDFRRLLSRLNHQQPRANFFLQVFESCREEGLSTPKKIFRRVFHNTTVQ